MAFKFDEQITKEQVETAIKEAGAEASKNSQGTVVAVGAMDIPPSTADEKSQKP